MALFNCLIRFMKCNFIRNTQLLFVWSILKSTNCLPFFHSSSYFWTSSVQALEFCHHSNGIRGRSDYHSIGSINDCLDKRTRCWGKQVVLCGFETQRAKQYFSVNFSPPSSTLPLGWNFINSKMMHFHMYTYISSIPNRLYFWSLQLVKYWRAHFKQHHCRYHNIIHQFQLFISDQPNQSGLRRNGKHPEEEGRWRPLPITKCCQLMLTV